MSIKYYTDRAEWIKDRRTTLGASDAAAALGESPWKTNVELWEEKVNPPPCADDGKGANEDIMRGVKSEEHIRQLLNIESGIRINNGADIVFVNDDDGYRFMSCTLDGFGEDQDGRTFCVEIKSVKRGHHEYTDSKIPIYYWYQVLHQLAVTKFDYAVFCPRLVPMDWRNGVCTERRYTVWRREVQDRIDELKERERKFWDCVESKRRPSAILPSL